MKTRSSISAPAAWAWTRPGICMTYAFAADITRRIRVEPVRAGWKNIMAAQHGLPLDLRITDLGRMMKPFDNRNDVRKLLRAAQHSYRWPSCLQVISDAYHRWNSSTTSLHDAACKQGG